jgi:NADH-quinone oxidoreductase subunit A
MPDAVPSSIAIVAYLALFFSVGLIFIFANLFIGRFLRPSDPHEEKLEIYECGEPAIGSSFVQFDLRFYVVALLFIIFDVEIAFFFPWATVFGKSNLMADPQVAVVQGASLTPEAVGLYKELGVRDPKPPERIPASLKSGFPNATSESASRPLTMDEKQQVVKSGFRQLAWVTIVDIAVFFTVLLVGFAYVWRRGDLNWVRALSTDETEPAARSSGDSASSEQQVVSA